MYAVPSTVKKRSALSSVKSVHELWLGRRDRVDNGGGYQLLSKKQISGYQVANVIHSISSVGWRSFCCNLRR